MVIIETTVFTRQVQALLTDDEYRRLQATLAVRPNVGVLIQGSGGLRKTRWALEGKGKSGGYESSTTGLRHEINYSCYLYILNRNGTI